MLTGKLKSHDSHFCSKWFLNEIHQCHQVWAKPSDPRVLYNMHFMFLHLRWPLILQWEGPKLFPTLSSPLQPSTWPAVWPGCSVTSSVRPWKPQLGYTVCMGSLFHCETLPTVTKPYIQPKLSSPMFPVNVSIHHFTCQPRSTHRQTIFFQTECNLSTINLKSIFSWIFISACKITSIIRTLIFWFENNPLTASHSHNLHEKEIIE